MAIDVFIPAVLLLVMIFIGVPVAYAMFISGTVGLVWIIGYGPTTGIIAGALYNNVASYILTTIPMFILMAEFLKAARLTEDLYVAMESFVGHLKGGLAIATTLANGLMAALTGSSTATVASLASIAVPEMRKFGYDDRLSVGTVAAAGSFAIMIPPSLGLIIVGILTETSISKLFIAGIIPGALTVIGYTLVITAWATINPEIDGESGRKSTWKERANATSTVWPAVLLIAIVLGGIYTGVITATEAGGIGAFGAFVIFVVFRDAGLQTIRESSRDAVQLATVIFFILMGAFIFSIYMGATGFTDRLLDMAIAAPLPDFGILLLIIFVYLILGMMMNQLAILILTIPVTYPLLVGGFGYNPIWFGIIIVKTVEIGLVTPPFGLNIFVATSTINVPTLTAFKGAAVFLISDVLILLLLLSFPEIVLVLI